MADTIHVDWLRITFPSHSDVLAQLSGWLSSISKGPPKPWRGGQSMGFGPGLSFHLDVVTSVDPETGAVELDEGTVGFLADAGKATAGRGILDFPAQALRNLAKCGGGTYLDVLRENLDAIGGRVTRIDLARTTSSNFTPEFLLHAVERFGLRHRFRHGRDGSKPYEARLGRRCPVESVNFGDKARGPYLRTYCKACQLYSLGVKSIRHPYTRYEAQLMRCEADAVARRLIAGTDLSEEWRRALRLELPGHDQFNDWFGAAADPIPYTSRKPRSASAEAAGYWLGQQAKPWLDLIGAMTPAQLLELRQLVATPTGPEGPYEAQDDPASAFLRGVRHARALLSFPTSLGSRPKGEGATMADTSEPDATQDEPPSP